MLTALIVLIAADSSITRSHPSLPRPQTHRSYQTFFGHIGTDCHTTPFSIIAGFIFLTGALYSNGCMCWFCDRCASYTTSPRHAAPQTRLFAAHT